MVCAATEGHLTAAAAEQLILRLSMKLHWLDAGSGRRVEVAARLLGALVQK
jgi:hypothetical protein